VLTDFGIAALLESGDADAIQLTPAGTRLGEIRYASPEQVRGEPVTDLSDVYAFGIVAFELLTGSHALDIGAPAAGVAGTEHTPPVAIAALADLAPELRSIVERCLAKDVNRRPRAQDVAAMLAAIR
jgi:serine/threonine-protein kinase